MKKNTKFFTLITLVIFTIGLFYIRLTLYLYNVETFKLFKLISNTFHNETSNTQQLTLFSSCYCQKELVHIKKHENSYEILVENHPNATKLFYSYRLDKKYFESLFFTCGLYNELRRGPSQKVLSFAFNSNSNNENSLNEIINFARIHYPNWSLRFYHKNTLSQAAKCEIQCKKLTLNAKHEFFYDIIDFCSVDDLPFNLFNKWSANYMQEETWRLLPIGDDFVDYFTSINENECFLANKYEKVFTDIKWLKSNAVSQLHVHTFNDDLDTLVSLVGFKNELNRKLARDIFAIITDEYLANSWHWPDEKTIFKQFILPILKNNYTLKPSSKQHKCIF